MHRLCLYKALVILVFCGLLPLLALPRRAHAQFSDIQVFNVAQEDMDGDGRIDRTIIDCAIITPNDRVIVYDGGRNMVESQDWETATDFADDTWIFDIGGQGENSTATLVIDFDQAGDEVVAQIYDPTVAGRRVQYNVSGISASVFNPVVPTMTIRALGDWLLPDGALNYNLMWTIDGPAANREQATRFPQWFMQDGNPDAEGQAQDRDRDGIPEFLWVTLLAPVPLSEGFPRSSAQVNSGERRPAALKNVVFWPLFNRPDDPVGQNYFDTPLYIEIDWEVGLIGATAFRGYPNEHGYHVNSLVPIDRDEVNELNFENPMAYYDLAGDRDGLPELFVRMIHYAQDDPYYLPDAPLRTPLQMVQYSWQQNDADSLYWDYKLDVAGRNPITTSVQLGDAEIIQVPHADLPRWVMEQTWAFGTFVATEDGPSYRSSEGLYEWSTLEGLFSYWGLITGKSLAGAQEYLESEIRPLAGSEEVQRRYLAGRSNESPESLYYSILAGYRAEYAEMNGRAELYFSPVDDRLHLVGATRGVYNIGDNQRIEYRNRDKDLYLDAWQYFVGARIEAQLYQTETHLIHSDRSSVTLLAADVPFELFRTQPPANTDEWSKLSAQLAEQQGDIPLRDLAALQAKFDGPGITITDATLR
ncbi:MAG: hypothetical protein MI924_11090, partial [Chloroflexales bacterium]|nr:hypothetical protein [Chloroflexales bacterium]